MAMTKKQKIQLLEFDVEFWKRQARKGDDPIQKVADVASGLKNTSARSKAEAAIADLIVWQCEAYRAPGRVYRGQP